MCAKKVPSHVGKLFKTMQESVCDGQILKLKCIEDYTIDVTTVELSTIATEEVRGGEKELEATKSKDTKVSVKLLSEQFSQITESPPTTLSSSTNNNNVGQTQTKKQQPICPPLDNDNYGPTQLENKTLYSSSTSGNGKENNIWNNNNTTESLFLKNFDLSKEEALSFVKSECHGHTSCNLDFRLPPPPPAVKIMKVAFKSNNTDSEETKKWLNNDEKRNNRKLLEIAYKCRPSKLKARTVCRNSKFQLECPQEKVILIASAEYGNWPNDTRTNEICSKNSLNYATLSNRQQIYNPENNSSSSSITMTHLSTNNVTTNKQLICIANQATTISAVISACLMKRSCQFDVQPDLLGDPKCQQQQPEYLKVVYVCANESSLIKLQQSKSNNTTATIRSSTSEQQQQKDFKQATVLSSNNTTTSSLLSPSFPSSNYFNFKTLPPATEPPNQTPALNEAASTEEQDSGFIVHEPQVYVTRLKTINTAGSSGPAQIVDSQQQYSLASFFSYPSFINSINSNFNTALLTTANSNGPMGNGWKQLAFVIGIVFLISILFTIAAYQRRRFTRGSSSSSSSTSSSSSSKNSCSKDSSKAFLGSLPLGSSTFGDSTTLHQQHQSNNNKNANKHNLVINSFMTSGAANVGQKREQQHNSCSESCFSLDEYNLNNNNCNCSTATNSPALNTATTTATTTSMNNQLHDYQQQQQQLLQHQQPYQHYYQQHNSYQNNSSSSFGTTSTIVNKPKLWTTMNVHHNGYDEQQQQQQRFSTQTSNNQTIYFKNNQHHNTMRPTRTFAGHPTPAPQIRCLQHSNNNNTLLTTNNNNTAPVGAGNLLSSNDLLLAMATAATQQMTAPTTTSGLPEANNNHFSNQDQSQNNCGGGWCAPAAALTGDTCSSSSATNQQQQPQLQFIFPPPAMEGIEENQQQLICSGGGNLVEEVVGATVGGAGAEGAGGSNANDMNCPNNWRQLNDMNAINRI